MIPPPSGASKTGKGRYPLSEVGAERSQPTEKEAAKQIKIQKNGSPETKGGRKRAVSEKRAAKRAEKGGFQGGHLICHVKTRFPEKAKERPDLGGLSSGGKIANGIVYTTDGRYVKILEIEPINFLLRSAREQQGIIYSFISYLKISPVKLQIKMISKSRHQ